MANWAQFWAVDMHVHTPGSQNAKSENYSTPAEIVHAAIDAGLDAMDHLEGGATPFKRRSSKLKVSVMSVLRADSGIHKGQSLCDFAESAEPTRPTQSVDTHLRRNGYDWPTGRHLRTQ